MRALCGLLVAVFHSAGTADSVSLLSSVVERANLLVSSNRFFCGSRSLCDSLCHRGLEQSLWSRVRRILLVISKLHNFFWILLIDDVPNQLGR